MSYTKGLLEQLSILLFLLGLGLLKTPIWDCTHLGQKGKQLGKIHQHY